MKLTASSLTISIAVNIKLITTFTKSTATFEKQNEILRISLQPYTGKMSYDENVNNSQSFQGVSLMMAATAIFGPAIFRARLFGDIPLARFFEVVLYVSGLLTSHPIILYNIYKSYKTKTGKMRPFCEAIRPLIPLASLFVISTIWVFLSNHNIAKLEPRLLFLCFGTIFSNFSVTFICTLTRSVLTVPYLQLQCRLIVAQMSDTRTCAWNSLLSLLVIATAICVFPYRHFHWTWFSVQAEQYVIYILTAVCTVLHLHYGASVVSIL